MGGVLVAVQQPIDEGGAFVGTVARKKGLGLVRRGQDADSVQVHPAQEGAVVTERKRLDTDAAELGEDMLVDETGGLGEPQIAARLLLDDDKLCRGCLAHCAGHNGCHAGSLRGDGPIVVQCHDGFVLDGVADFRGQIARRAVGQPAHHDDRLALARAGQHPLARMDLESLQPRLARTVRRALPQPFEDGRVFVRRSCHELASAVRDREARLGQQ